MSEKLTCAQRLQEALARKDMTQADLCRMTGIGKSAMSQYVNGGLIPRQDRIFQLAQALNVSEAWLMGYDVPATEKAPSLTDEAAQIAERYAALDHMGRGAVSALIKFYEDQNAEPEAATKVIPFILQSMAAGSGESDFGNIELDTYEVPVDSKAEFACRIHGDSLEPYYHDQDVLLAVKATPEIGEVGVFLVDGEYKVKQYVADGYGNVYLLAVNRKRADTDQTLWGKDEHTVVCLGTVLMPKRIPLP